jgi:hypothetical protein
VEYYEILAGLKYEIFTNVRHKDGYKIAKTDDKRKNKGMADERKGTYLK